MTKVTTADRIEIAEWLGWKWAHSFVGNAVFAKMVPPGAHGSSLREGATIEEETIPHYDTCLNACQEFQKMAWSRGLWEKYATELARQTQGLSYLSASEKWCLWIGAIASPGQRSRAILAVIREKEGK